MGLLLGLLFSFGGGALAVEVYRHFAPRLQYVIALLPSAQVRGALCRLLPAERALTVALIATGGIIIGTMMTSETLGANALTSSIAFSVLGCFARQLLPGLHRGAGIAVNHAGRRLGNISTTATIYAGAGLVAAWGFLSLISTPEGQDVAINVIIFGGIIWFAWNRLAKKRSSSFTVCLPEPYWV